MDLLTKLEEQLRSQTTGRQSADFFWQRYDQGVEGIAGNEFLQLFTGAVRRLGRDLPEFDNEGRKFIQENFPSAVCEFSVGKLGRLLLVLRRQSDTEIISEIIDRGDNGEQSLVLQVLSLFNDGSRFLKVAINACRTNSTEVFSSIALDNSYPAANFSDHDFNHLVVKAVFLGLEITRISGLERRYQEDLGRMLKDLYEERRSAGRDFPASALDYLKKHGAMLPDT